MRQILDSIEQGFVSKRTILRAGSKFYWLTKTQVAKAENNVTASTKVYKYQHDYVAKPVSRHSLIEEAEQLLEKGRAEAEAAYEEYDGEDAAIFAKAEELIEGYLALIIEPC